MVAPGPAPDTSRERMRRFLPRRLPQGIPVLLAAVLATCLQGPATAETFALLTRQSPSAVTSSVSTDGLPSTNARESTERISTGIPTAASSHTADVTGAHEIRYFSEPARLIGATNALLHMAIQAVIDAILAYEYQREYFNLDTVLWVRPIAVNKAEVIHTLFPFGALHREGCVLADGLMSLDERDTFIRFHRVPQTRSTCRAIAPFDITDASLARGVRAYVRIDHRAIAGAIEREKARNLLEYPNHDAYEDDTDQVRESILRMYECRKETGIGYW